MPLIRLGDYIEAYAERCNTSNLTPNHISGINRDREFFEPSKQVGSDTSKYKLVPPNYFACNLMHVGRDEVLPIAINRTGTNKVVSPAYTVFRIINENVILPDFLFMLVNSNEKDRYFWFHCDSSVRDGMDWDSFCDLEFDIPTIEIQNKYVAIYEGLLNNLKIYQSKLDDLKLVCDGYIEDLRKKYPSKLTNLLLECDEKNNELSAVLEKGVSIDKVFIPTKATSSNIRNQKVVQPGSFAFNSNTSRNGDFISIALNNSNENYAVSNTYIVFKCDTKVNAMYLNLWFHRKEFDKFARFKSWGSARETIDIEEIESYVIGLPPIEIQNDIVAIFEAYNKRKEFVEKLKNTIRNICPILIKGAIEEGSE